MDAELIDLVWRRARANCEYCRMPQEFDDLPFHVDHILAQKHRGITVPNNLALACYRCNTFKGSNIAGIDPLTNMLCRLYNPREDIWTEHFIWRRSELIGSTEIGRTTIIVLEINRLPRINHRAALILEGVFPPDDGQ